jgi:hypothetical protein
MKLHQKLSLKRKSESRSVTWQGNMGVLRPSAPAERLDPSKGPQMPLGLTEPCGAEDRTSGPLGRDVDRSRGGFENCLLLCEPFPRSEEGGSLKSYRQSMTTE